MVQSTYVKQEYLDTATDIHKLNDLFLEGLANHEKGAEENRYHFSYAFTLELVRDALRVCVKWLLTITDKELNTVLERNRQE